MTATSHIDAEAEDELPNEIVHLVDQPTVPIAALGVLEYRIYDADFTELVEATQRVAQRLRRMAGSLLRSRR